MRRAAYHYDVMVDLEFTSQEVDYLVKLAKSHYDAKCRHAAEVGGFLYGIVNALGSDAGVIWTFDGQSLGTLAKICEQETFRPPCHAYHFLMTQIRERAGEWKRVTAEAHATE